MYGKQGIFDADRLIDLLNAFESFTVAAQSSRGDMDQEQHQQQQQQQQQSANGRNNGVGIFGNRQQLFPQLPLLLPPPLLAPGAAFGDGAVAAAGGPAVGLFGLPSNRFDLRQQATLDSQGRLREALRFIFSPEGSFFRTFILDEVVKSIDALSREQLVVVVQRLRLERVRLPVLLPGQCQHGLVNRRSPLAQRLFALCPLASDASVSCCYFMLHGQRPWLRGVHESSISPESCCVCLLTSCLCSVVDRVQPFHSQLLVATSCSCRCQAVICAALSPPV